MVTHENKLYKKRKKKNRETTSNKKVIMNKTMLSLSPNTSLFTR